MFPIKVHFLKQRNLGYYFRLLTLSFTTMASLYALSDEVLREVKLRDPESHRIYYFREYKVCSGVYYFKFFGEDEVEMNVEVTGHSNMNADNEVTVYFESSNHTYEVLSNSIPSYNYYVDYTIFLSK